MSKAEIRNRLAERRQREEARKSEPTSKPGPVLNKILDGYRPKYKGKRVMSVGG